MTALSEQRQIDRLEKRLDESLDLMRREARADFRLLLGALFTVLFAVVILGFAAVIAAT
jgi:hypothetical protein